MFDGLNRTTNIIFQCANKLLTCLHLDSNMFELVCQDVFLDFFELFLSCCLVYFFVVSIYYHVIIYMSTIFR